MVRLTAITPADLGHRDHVGIGLAAGGVDELLLAHRRQHAQAVAQQRGGLEIERGRGGVHLLGDPFGQRAGLAVQQLRGRADVARVGFRRDELDARRGAALDLVQQAGARAVGEHGVLAGAQLEHLLQQLDALAHRVGIGVGAERLVVFLRCAAKIGEARKAVAGQQQIGVGLVVAEQDVEARLQPLDQVVFQQQRLGLGARHRGVDVVDALQHQPDARALVGFLEIAGNALLQVLRLADVQHRAGRVDHAVDAGQGGQRGEKFLVDAQGSVFVEQLAGDRPVLVGQFLERDVGVRRRLARVALQRGGDFLGDFLLLLAGQRAGELDGDDGHGQSLLCIRVNTAANISGVRRRVWVL
jgi:hypothetical protein